MAPPFTKESRRLLKDLRKTLADAPESWESYPVILKGETKSYNEAASRAQVLVTENHAYSTENKEHAQQKSAAATKIFEHQTKITAEEQLRKIFGNVSESDSSDSDSMNSSHHDSHDEVLSSTDSEVPSVKNKKKKLPMQKKPTHSKESPLTSVKKICAVADPVQNMKETERNSKAQPTKASEQMYQVPTKKNVSPSVKLTTPNPTQLDKVVANPLHEPANNIQTKSLDQIINKLPEGTRLLYLAIKGLTQEVKKNSEDIRLLRNSIKGVLKKKIDPVTIDRVAEKYKIESPLRTIAQLDDFNTKLTDDLELHTQFVTALEHLADGDVLKTVASIIKKIFDRRLAKECTAVKKMKEKYLLKDTKIYKILFELVCRHHTGKNGEPVSEREYRKVLGSVVYNAKDWDGHRHLRRPPVPVPVPRPVELDQAKPE